MGIESTKIGSTCKVIIDRKEGNYFVGRTESDSPDVDNEVLIDATQIYLKTGEFVDVVINDAADFDLYGEVVKSSFFSIPYFFNFILCLML